MNFNTRYAATRIPGTVCPEPSITQQQFKDDSDINNILARYRQVDLIPVGDREPIYGDFSDPNIGDYHAAMETIRGVGELMHNLPAKVRARFNNDPTAILQFVSDKANQAEAYELGLLDPNYKPPTGPPGPVATGGTTPPTTPPQSP